jgi:hypothetical protein
MSLIELLVVLIIIGAVSSIALYTLQKSPISSPAVSLATLKKVLWASSEGSNASLICTLDCRECSIRFEQSKKILPLSFKKEGEIVRYGFDRYGELRPLGHPIISTEKGYREISFALTVTSNGLFSPLILKNNHTFYAYTPLGNDEPLITQSEEKVRELFYNEDIAPIRNGSYYGAP